MTAPMSVFTAGTHPCAAVGCTTKTDKRRLMCDPCWAKVPNWIKVWVFRTRHAMLHPRSPAETMEVCANFRSSTAAAMMAVQEAGATEAQNRAKTREGEADGVLRPESTS